MAMQLQLFAPEAESKTCLGARQRALSEGASSGRARAESSELDPDCADYRFVVRRTFLDLEVSSNSSRAAADCSSTVAGSSESADLEGTPRAATPCWSDNEEDEGAACEAKTDSSPTRGPTEESRVNYAKPPVFVPCYMVPIPVLSGSGPPAPASAGWTVPPPPPPPAQAQATGVEEQAASTPAAPAAPLPTTLLLKHLWSSCTTQELAEFLDSLGFIGCYDFLYVPANLRESRAFGFAFVNMVSHLAALVLKERFDGYLAKEGADALAVQWCDAHQGLAAQIERYRESPIMHEDVPDRFKPMLFQGGRRQPFPPPTRPIQFPSNAGGRAPRPRASRNHGLRNGRAERR